MMSDMSFLTPSPWLTEGPLMKDGLLPDTDGLTGLPFENLDLWGTGQDVPATRSWDGDCDLPSSYQNSEISVANSECSEAYSVDVDTHLVDALLHNIGNTDLLSAAVINQPSDHVESTDYLSVYEEPEYIQAWSDDSDDDIWETESQSSQEMRERILGDVMHNDCRWSSLSDQQQLHLVEDLSTIVSRELGLREQLDIIRIINPCASVSPTDTEFVIDLTCLDDNKLEEVCQYIRHNSTNNNHHHDNTRSRSRSAHHHGNQPGRLDDSLTVYGHSENLSNRHDNLSDDDHHDNLSDNDHPDNPSDNESTSSSLSRKPRKRTQKLTHRRRSSTKQKRARQQLKEERSGLFAQEQILAVESTAGEEVDVDILT